MHLKHATMHPRSMGCPKQPRDSTICTVFFAQGIVGWGDAGAPSNEFQFG